MHKLTVTIGIDDKGQPVVIAGPNDDVDGQKDALRKMTDAGGKVGKGKDAKSYSFAVILHATKGMLTRRTF